MGISASLVVPVYNRVDLTIACLRSLRRHQGDDDLELIVVDNGSHDGSADAVRAEWPGAVVVRNDHNQGFARGCNQGAARASHQLVVFVNNDTEAHEGWLPPLARALAEPGVGLVAPRLLFPDGTLQHAGMYLVEDRVHGLALNGVHRFYRQPADLPAANVRTDCTIVTGAVLATARTIFIEVGGFDEGYWNGCEDVDFCLAVRASGRRVVYEPASVLTHHESASGAERWTALSANLDRLARRWAERAVVDLVLLGDGGVVPTGGMAEIAAGTPISAPTATATTSAATPGAAGAATPATAAAATPATPATPATAAAAAAAAATPASALAHGRVCDGPLVRIAGSVFGFHSLAQVNRELAVRLAQAGLEVVAHSAETPDLSPADDARLAGVAAATVRHDGARAAVTLRQQWPPDWTAPPEGTALVICQPWEFGGLPDSWVPPLVEHADEIWCYTTWVRDCYLRSGVPADRLVVMPIGVDTERFAPTGPVLPLRTEATCKLLFVGGAVHRKGIDVLLDAYQRAFTAADDVCLVVKTFGASTFYRGMSSDAAVRALAARPDRPRIELIDAELSQAQMAALYRACDVLVHPYRGEGFGMPIAEAMACGLAVVVTGDGAAMDFCDERNAYLVPSSRRSVAPAEVGLPPSRAGYWLAEPDPDGLVELLRHVVAHPEEAAAKGLAGRARAVEQLAWGPIVAEASARLAALAERPSGPARREAAFGPNGPRYPLDDPRALVVVVDAVGGGDGGTERLRRAAAALTGRADATLVVHVAADGIADVGSALDGADVDVLVVTPALDDADLAALYRRADIVVAGPDERSAVLAARCGALVLADEQLAELRSAPPGVVPSGAA